MFTFLRNVESNVYTKYSLQEITVSGKHLKAAYSGIVGSKQNNSYRLGSGRELHGVQMRCCCDLLRKIQFIQSDFQIMNKTRCILIRFMKYKSFSGLLQNNIECIVKYSFTFAFFICWLLINNWNNAKILKTEKW